MVKNILNKSKDTYLPFWKTSNLKSHIVPACCCCSRFRGTNQRRLNPMRIKTNTNNKKLSTTVFNAPVQFTPFRPQRAELTHTHTHTQRHTYMYSYSPMPWVHKDSYLCFSFGVTFLRSYSVCVGGVGWWEWVGGGGAVCVCVCGLPSLSARAHTEAGLYTDRSIHY